MTDDYKIAIRCEHVTIEGNQRSPRVAWATFFEDTGTWSVASTIPHRLTDHPRDPRSTLHDGNGTQSPRMSGVAESGESWKVDGPEDWRVELTCQYQHCRQRLVTRKARLDAALNRFRHAGVHTTTLSKIRANL